MNKQKKQKKTFSDADNCDFKLIGKFIEDTMEEFLVDGIFFL